ncbi:MAG: helix-hairpin-helix domain-containing protein [bacterium]
MSNQEEEKKQETKNKIREQIGILLICLVLVLSGFLLLNQKKDQGEISFVAGDNTVVANKSTDSTVSTPQVAEKTTTASISEKININTASIEDLDKLSGVGPATAQKIIDYRAQNGGFKSIEEVKEVSGIGDVKYSQMKDNITI